MRRRQRGVALLTAVMVVAFASTIAAGMLVRQNLAVHRTANLEQFAQAWWYLIGLEQWATRLLARDREESELDSLDEPWAQPVDFIPVDEGALAGVIVDLQGRFNINALGKSGEEGELAQERLTRVFRALPELQSRSPEGLAAAIRDWVDADSNPSYPQGAEDGSYMALERPYRTANQPFVSLSELLLVEGIDGETYQLIRPHLSALPDDSLRINVNTASAAVLTALHEDLTLPEAEGLVARREESAFESVQQFLEDETLAGRPIPEALLSVRSYYFQASGSARIGNMQMSLASLFRRDDSGRTVVLKHARGAL